MTTTELSHSVRRAPVDWSEWIIEMLIRVLGFSGIGFVVLIFLFLIREGSPTFWEIPIGELTGTHWYPALETYGLVPLILGSLVVTIGAIVIAVPLGVAVAVFLAEVAPEWVRNILKPTIEVIAGIPSVVLGFLGIVALSHWIRVNLGVPTGLSAITGSLLLAYMA
ncbi:MAG: PstC family ABC transporter permease, partial [Ardenticatenaceae bacterium]